MCCLFAVRLRGLKPKSKLYPNEINSLGDHIRQKRLDAGLHQEEIAGQIGVDKATICNWETNRREPETRHMPRIIEFLGYVPYATPQSFGEWLKTCRIAAGLSQKRLAKAIGMDPSTIREWESGSHQPIERSLRRVKSFFKV